MFNKGCDCSQLVFKIHDIIKEITILAHARVIKKPSRKNLNCRNDPIWNASTTQKASNSLSEKNYAA